MSSEIRVSFGDIEGAEANIGRGASAIEQELADLDSTIAQLAVWDGAAADFYRRRQQQIRTSWEDALREVEESGGKPYGIPAGASEHPLGGLGFANWAYEVVQQEKELGLFFDTIVVCTVTGSTWSPRDRSRSRTSRP